MGPMGKPYSLNTFCLASPFWLSPITLRTCKDIIRNLVFAGRGLHFGCSVLLEGGYGSKPVAFTNLGHLGINAQSLQQSLAVFRVIFQRIVLLNPKPYGEAAEVRRELDKKGPAEPCAGTTTTGLV